jgi:hypothetical protein
MGGRRFHKPGLRIGKTPSSRFLIFWQKAKNEKIFAFFKKAIKLLFQLIALFERLLCNSEQGPWRMDSTPRERTRPLRQTMLRESLPAIFCRQRENTREKHSIDYLWAGM